MKNNIGLFQKPLTPWNEGKILADWVKLKRLKSGRYHYSALRIIDAQSIKTTHKGEQRGFVGEKNAKGCVNVRLLWTAREVCV